MVPFLWGCARLADDLQHEAASSWAMGLPAGEHRTVAINALARSYTHRPFTGLGDWLSELGNDERARAVEILQANYGSDEKKTELAEVLDRVE